MPRLEVTIDSDEWAMLALAELRATGVKAELRIVLNTQQRIVDCYIVLPNGEQLRQPKGTNER